MSEKASHYKSIFKATSIFGGVQVFNILVTLIRGKAVALLIGTAGMGLNGLFMSGLNLIKTVSSLGLTESAVRDLSKAHASGDEHQMQITFAVFKKWIWITAALGILITVLFSSLLSQFSFNNHDYTWSYIALSSTFIFGALMGGIYTMLRGTRQLKYLAQANIFGGVAGLLVALPILFFMGIKGVVPAIIATAFATYLVSLYFKNKIQLTEVKVSWQETINLGMPMVKLGLSLTVVNLLASAVAFALNGYISKTGTLSEVGLYNAGLAIVDGYVGMVFTAMSTDYFPRLSALIHDEKQWKQVVNQQAELVLIILGIVLVLLISTTPILIRLLLSASFLPAQNFIFWAVLAIPLKGLVWVLGFIILAKGDNKLFLGVEITANMLLLLFNIGFYTYKGIDGLGISMLVSYLVFIIMMLSVLKVKYSFSFEKNVYLLLAKDMIPLALCMVCIYTLGYPQAYFFEAIIVAITLGMCYVELNKRMNIKSILLNLKARISG
ncbi:oligosaccharide flippase family protein [Flavobacterium sp. CYK-55]|uniref:oligosaccharide flippase family protein n=1 Tax=Flavobacterium sp. CYK-55 TaxID=2835529 RepID=UPI001BD0F397|nr:oligosaccharide flippase family protein [Flavobacterium sp. CYK-55]MBS7786442.1 oligosaccharide flippase family protein [Flavobacterium sp. CYK-55]